MKHNLEEIDQLSLGFENWKPIKHNLLYSLIEWHSGFQLKFKSLTHKAEDFI